MGDKYRFIAALDKRSGITRMRGSLMTLGQTQPPADPPPTWKEKDESRRAIYLAYLDDFARIGSRHETTRSFYITVLTLLLGLIALGGPGGVFEAIRWHFFVALGLVGIIVCVAWGSHMKSFGSLFKAKRQTLEKLEAQGPLPLQPFMTEATVQEKRTRLSDIDRYLAWAFGILFACLVVAKFVSDGPAPSVPWCQCE